MIYTAFMESFRSNSNPVYARPYGGIHLKKLKKVWIKKAKISYKNFELYEIFMLFC